MKTRPSSALRAPSPRERGEGELLMLPLAPRERGEGGQRPGEGLASFSVVMKFLFVLLIACSAEAQIASGTLHATVNGSAPVVLQLQYCDFAQINSTVPVVTVNGNVINVVSENHLQPLPFEPTVQCLSPTAVVGNLAPGTYTVNWRVLALVDLTCANPPCLVSDPLQYNFTTQFTAPVVIASVPAMGDWLLIALVLSCVVIGLLRQ